ncbi:ABC transporter substrate-binding protein [Gordonia sp. CPCC 205333]
MALQVGLAGAVAVGVLSGCGEEPPLTTPEGKLISTSTTRIADVNVVSADRDFARTCLAPTAPDAGKSDVARIVVTDPALLDAICGLGIGPKVVAVTAAAGSVPAYLGPQLTGVPAVGTSPDAAAVASAKPDVVLTTPETAASAKAFRTAKVETIAPGSWQERFQSVASALGRSQAGEELLDEFTTEATKTGRRMDAAHNEVSLVRFGANSEMIAGTDSFGGQILSLVGVQRPGPQRHGQQTTLSDKTFNDADGDLILVSFQGDAGLAHGKEVLLSDRWLDMGAPTWKRVMIVNDDVWYRSSGLAAGWLVLNDIKGSLDGNSAQF